MVSFKLATSSHRADENSVPTGRLANLDHKLQVLVIEAGENNLNNPWASVVK